MKKYILSIIALVLGMISAFAQTFSVDDVTIKAGETKVVSINLNNTQTNIVSFQMDITLPDGITINKSSCALGNRITDTDQKLTIGKQLDGSIRLTSTSFALSPVTGTSGEIVKLSLTAAKDAEGGTASVKNIVLATSNSEKLKPANVYFKVNVSYILSYMVDGTVYETVPVASGTTLTPEAMPTKEGYTFSGWSEISTTMPAKDVVVTGTFTINSYTLTYQVDGTEYKKLTVEYGATITPEAEPTKEGYTFSGWSEIPATMPAKDVTVTGSFTINSYTLTYLLDGEEYQSFSVKYRDPITPLDAPQKEGYTFSGWDGLPRSMPAKDIVVKGYFTINSYTITYVLDGETYTTETLEYGAKIVPPVISGLEDYSIWEDVPETMPAKDITIYGKSKDIIDGFTPMFSNGKEEVFDLNGRKLSAPQKGINIIRMSDGTSRKVLIR